ncbi:MAG: DnaT-like ssDNA-binding domain-containing protein [Luminiphilus sp.]
MSQSTFLPEKYCSFSAELAATVGVEAAILLQGLSHHPHPVRSLDDVSLEVLVSNFPFWDEKKISALLVELVELGILAATAAGTSDQGQQQVRSKPSGESLAKAASWQPSSHSFELLRLNHGIDASFAEAQLASFDASGDQKSLDARFTRHVLAAWRRKEAHPAFEIEPPRQFDQQWQPSTDAVEIMHTAGISDEFIESVRPEFILYWRERGGAPKDVNSKFIQYARQKMAHHDNGLQHTTIPQQIAADFQPNEAVYETLAMAGVDRAYASSLVGEFVLYWRDSKQVHTSWNSKFLQHVKFQYQRQQEQLSGEASTGGGSGSIGRTKDRSIVDDLSDTSWAS